MDKDRVSRLCRALDEQIEIFRDRPLDGAYPYLWLDAKQLKVRDQGHVGSKAAVIAYVVHERGSREIVGMDLGEIESEAFWLEFLRSLKARGLEGVKLVISGHHEGLKHAIARTINAPWQRCTVHFVRNMHQRCRPAQRGLDSAALREVFDAADATPGTRARHGRDRPPGADRPEGRPTARHAEDDLIALQRIPRRALDQAVLAQPARAGQPRDRPALRRRRDLPQRRRRDPSRRPAPDRTERRVARRLALPLRREHAARPMRDPGS
jgi:transposase-like protein